MSKLKDLTGQTFGKLIVIERAENDRRGNTQWLCRCECGNIKIVLGYQLTSGKTRSCGCWIMKLAKCLKMREWSPLILN